MNILIVNVRKNGKDTPVFVTAPEHYTESQILETIHVPEGVDGYTVTMVNLGAIDDEILDQYNISSFDPFFPDNWYGMY